MKSNLLKYTLSTLLTTVVVSGVVYAASVWGIVTQTISDGATMSTSWFQAMNDMGVRLNNIIDTSGNITTAGSIKSTGDITTSGKLVIWGVVLTTKTINSSEDVYGVFDGHEATYATTRDPQWKNIIDDCDSNKYSEFSCSPDDAKTCTDVKFVSSVCVDGVTLWFVMPSTSDSWSLIPKANAMISAKTVDGEIGWGGGGGGGVYTTCGEWGALYISRTVTCKKAYTIVSQ